VAFRFAMMVEKVAVGSGGRREKKRKSMRSDQTVRMEERASTPLSICLSDLQGRDEAVAQKEAQNSLEGSILGLSIEGERVREPRGAPMISYHNVYVSYTLSSSDCRC
jgi:hypothetical protein